jgi:hypothetical protein
MPRSSSIVVRIRQGRGRRVLMSGSPYFYDSAHRVLFHYPCPYCPTVLLTEAGRTRHILWSTKCQEAERLRIATNGEVQSCVGVDELLEDEGQPISCDPNELDVAVEPTVDQPETPPLDKPSPNSHASPRSNMFMLRFVHDEKIYVKRFPNLHAGAPVSNIVASAPDLHSYLTGTGTLGNPELFETAELLMTTGLTSSGRDRHLKSRLVSRFLIRFRVDTYERLEV